MGLDDIVYSSVEIRNFLKLFSEHQWNKVCKATLLLGIARLEELTERYSGKGFTSLSLEAIDELVVAAHKKAQDRKNKRAAKTIEHVEPQLELETTQEQHTSVKKEEPRTQSLDSADRKRFVKAPSAWRREGSLDSLHRVA